MRLGSSLQLGVSWTPTTRGIQIVKPEQGVRIHDTITRLEWKITENSLNAKCVYAQEWTNRFLESASGNLISTLQYSRLLRRDYYWLLQRRKERRLLRTIPSKPTCSGIWEMTSSIFSLLTGGPNLFQRGTFFSYLRAFMARDRLLVNGILIYQHGWRIMDSRQ